jgi:hypothetical protein
LYPFFSFFFSLLPNIDKYDYKNTLNPLCKGSGRWWGPLKCVSISRLQLKNPPLLASFFHRKNSKGQKNWHVPSPSISLWKVAALASCTCLALMTLAWTFLRLFHLSFSIEKNSNCNANKFAKLLWKVTTLFSLT